MLYTAYQSGMFTFRPFFRRIQGSSNSGIHYFSHKTVRRPRTPSEIRSTHGKKFKISILTSIVHIYLTRISVNLATIALGRCIGATSKPPKRVPMSNAYIGCDLDETTCPVRHLERKQTTKGVKAFREIFPRGMAHQT